jgi:hypothetical protein
VANNLRIQKSKEEDSAIKVINSLSGFKEEKNLYLLPYQLTDKNWVLLCRNSSSKFYVFTMFKDTENIEKEIKSIFDNQLPKSYKWQETTNNKLLDRKPETVEESFIWTLSFMKKCCEIHGSKEMDNKWNDDLANVIKNVQKYLIDDTRRQYWDLLLTEGEIMKSEKITGWLTRVESKGKKVWRENKNNQKIKITKSLNFVTESEVKFQFPLELLVSKKGDAKEVSKSDEGKRIAEIVSDESAIWGLDRKGKISFRDGVDEETPKGTGWLLVENEENPLKYVTVKNNQIWGVGLDDELWVRCNINDKWTHADLGKFKEDVTKLEVLNQNLEGNLDLQDFTKLKYLDCSNNKLTGLDASNLTNLKEINCSNNQLTSNNKVNLSGLTDLEKFSGKHNLFTNLEPFSDLENLKHLELTDNDFHKFDEEKSKKQDLGLEIFKNFPNLESLLIGNHRRGTAGNIYNLFGGSLEPLTDLKNLKELEIGWTNIDDGLRHLPEGLETIWCYGEGKYKGYGPLENRSSKVVDKLRNFRVQRNRGKFENWLEKKNKKEADLSSFGDGWEENCVNDEDLHKWRSSLDNQYDYKSWRKDYNEQRKLVEENKIYPELSWREVKKAELLPSKLYNFKENKVVWTKYFSDIKSYAILSYSWGDLLDKSSLTTLDYLCQRENGEKESESKQIGVSEKDNAHGTTKQSIKALEKATKVCQNCEYLGISHLWVDQLCIDQFNDEEVNQEVPKMRQYYDNVYVTLIDIPVNLLEELSSIRSTKAKASNYLILDWPHILEVIINSEWFTRTWTMQEGWLSKQTIFMFDDMMVDGRFMAAVWAFQNPNHTRYNKYKDLKEFNEYSKKIATPIGWTYYEEGYNFKDMVSLRLDEALRAVKDRNRSVPVDGVYAILGLLPYGEQVKPKYKKWGEKYSKKDVEEALLDVMKTAIKNGYGEPLAWCGEGSNTSGRCWIPEVVFYEEDAKWEEKQKNGSTKVMGGLEIKYITPRNKDNKVIIDDNKVEKIVTEKGIVINGSVYLITCWGNSIDRVDEKSIVDGGLHRREVEVQVAHTDSGHDLWEEKTKVALWGTRKALEKIGSSENYSKYLIIPNKNWKSKDSEAFAILALSSDDSGDNACYYHRIDLVRLGEGVEELKGVEGRKIVVGINNKQLEKQELQIQIEIPPKK